MLDSVTIDQLRMLIAVVDNGSFTAGAKAVQRAQSAVSQAIATLEFQLDLKLFDRSTRRPTLTAEGEAIVADARAVVDRARALRERASALAGGVEANVTLATALLVPLDTLTDVLARFDGSFPTTNLDLLVEEAGGPLELVAAGAADLGIAGEFNVRGADDAIAREAIGTIPIVAVAAPSHPLAALGGPVGGVDLREHRQLTSASGRGAGTASPLSLRTWPIADQSVRRALLRGGFGWGIVPRHVVADDLDGGELVALDLEGLRGPALRETLTVLYRRDAPPGPAGRWIIDALKLTLDD